MGHLVVGTFHLISWGFPGDTSGKELASSGDISDMGLIPGSGKYPGTGMAAQASVLAWRIPRDRRAWRATVQRVSKSQT